MLLRRLLSLNRCVFFELFGLHLVALDLSFILLVVLRTARLFFRFFRIFSERCDLLPQSACLSLLPRWQKEQRAEGTKAGDFRSNYQFPSPPVSFQSTETEEGECYLKRHDQRRA